MKEYKTEYKIVHWADPQELESQLNDMVNKGWRVDHHKVGSDPTGWTIYSKTTVVMPDIMEARMPLRELWRILNSTAVFNAKSGDFSEYANPVTEEISRQVKAYYEKNAQEMQ